MTVKANYNMEFDQGKFYKNKIYKARVEDKKIFVTTEEKKEQGFWNMEFNTFFTLLKN